MKSETRRARAVMNGCDGLFEDNHTLYASQRDITWLEVDEGIQAIYCAANPELKELKLPESLHRINCDPDLFNYEQCKTPEVHIYYYNPYISNR